MSVKMRGAEFKAYMSDKSPEFWPDGSFYDYTDITVNGSSRTGEGCAG